MEIIFIKVADNQSKTIRLCKRVEKHFQNGQGIIVMAPNKEAALYLDQLLWKCPVEGFLPHTIANSSAKDKIVITTQQENLNNATILFNLLPDIPPIYTQFKMIYELHDETHPDKLKLSLKRQQDYKNAGYAFQLEDS